MAAVVTGSKVITRDAFPDLTAAALTEIMATPVESLTVGQIQQLSTALARVPYGGVSTNVVGDLLQ